MKMVAVGVMDGVAEGIGVRVGGSKVGGGSRVCEGVNEGKGDDGGKVSDGVKVGAVVDSTVGVGACPNIEKSKRGNSSPMISAIIINKPVTIQPRTLVFICFSFVRRDGFIGAETDFPFYQIIGMVNKFCNKGIV